MNWLSRIARRLFASRFRREPTPGAIARMRLEELRREQSRNHWEIRPPSSECEMPVGPELSAFPGKTVGRTAAEPADKVRISVNRVR
jgi:hypothetical protein